MLNGPGEFVQLRNEGAEDLHYRYLGSNHTLIAGQNKIVPWGHLDYLMGNPYLTGADRSERLAQILARRGARRMEDLDYTLVATDADNDPIRTILDDPEGVYALNQPNTSDELDPAALRAAMAQMGRRMSQMEQQLAYADAAAAAQPADPDSPPQGDVVAVAREKALSNAATAPVGVVNGTATDDAMDQDIISAVSPHLVPPTQVPVDAPTTADIPTRTPTV